MNRSQSQQSRIDEIMEQASTALVNREYFLCERLGASALRKALAAQEYECMARILLPLQEARRQKRDLAIDAGKVRLVDGPVPFGDEIVPGCYLITPPRVGMDGRVLREAADERGVPVLVVVREPATRDGLWPIVAVGPVTVRTRVAPPPEIAPAPRAAGKGASKKKASKPERSPEPPTELSSPAPGAEQRSILPATEWFLAANEALGDAAIAQVSTDAPAAVRVEQLMMRLEALRDHEKLHQRLGEACRAAAREPLPKRRPIDPLLDDGDA